MSQIEKTVFISYRRVDIPWAIAVYQDLTTNGFDCFLDYQNINSGGFEEIILENIASRVHFLLLLTPSALERCREPGDWLRREIEHALDLKRNIVTLTMDDFNFKNPKVNEYLTGKLSKLREYNALHVPPHFFKEAMVRVRERFLNVPLDAVIHPGSQEAEHVAQLQQQAVDKKLKTNFFTFNEWFVQALLSDNVDDQIEYYTKALEIKSDSAHAHHNRGTILAGNGNALSAIDDFTKAIEFRSDFSFSHLGRGAIYLKLNKIPEALNDFDRAIQLEPYNANAYSLRGNALHEDGKFCEAIRDYDRAISLKPDCAEFYFNRGLTYRYQNYYSQSVDDYNRAIQLRPNYARAYFNRAAAHTYAGHTVHAIRDFTKSIELKTPNTACAYLNRGNLWKKQNNFDAALSDYSKAIDLNPQMIDAWFSRAKIYSDYGKNDMAISDYSESIALKPDFAEAYNDRGHCYFKQKDYISAIADYTEAILFNPNFALSYNNRAWTLYIMEDYFLLPQALDDVSRSLEINPDDANALHTRGAIYMELEQYGSAIVDFKNALYLDPNMSIAKDDLYRASKLYEELSKNL